MFATLRNTRRSGANMALALALVTGGALGVTALEAPAHAQKKKKKDDAAKPEYSKAFIEAYQPVDASLKSDAPDLATIKTQLPGVAAASATGDDKYAAGGLYYNVGRVSQDTGLQMEGIKLMLSSGKTPAENVPQFNLLAGQMAYNAQDYTGARTYLTRANEAGSDPSETAGLIAETYFNENRYQEGLTFLTGQIEARQATGLEVDEAWIKRGLAIAYEGDLTDEAVRYSVMYVTLHPTPSAWGDAIAIQRNLLNYQSQETLDLLRLARRAKVMRNERDYLDYVDAADYRRLPGEVVAVLGEGVSNGSLDTTNPYVVEVRDNAIKRVSADRSELPSLAADARKAGASATLMMAAGDAYLNYNEPATAEEFYAMALGSAGENTPRVLTRLGIAQLDQGKTAEAKATFARVDGSRRAIARLWDAYADSVATPAAAAPAAAVTPAT